MSDPIQRRSFGRVAKLLSIFGYGSSTPYNVASLKKDNEMGSGGNGMLRGSINTWFEKRMDDNKDFSSQISDWKDMVSYSPVAAAVRIIVEECIQTEHSCPATIWVEGGSTETEDMINELYTQKLECEDVIRAQFWWIASYGNNFEKLILGPEGVHGWRFVDLEKIERVVDEQRRLVGFNDKDEEPPEGENSSVLWGEDKNERKLWRPWDYVHQRLMGDNRQSEYGTSLLKPAVHVYKKLRMAEDQMITYRLQLQPSRYVMSLDTGEAPVTDVWEMVHQWGQYLRSSRLIDADTNQYDHRYNPWSLDDIVIIPKRKDSQTSFDKLDGDADVPDITDVKYLMRMLAGMLNIPPEFLGVEPEGGSTLSGKSSLAIQDLRFLRSIKAVRAAVMQGYDKVARIHLALNDKDPFVPFRVKMSNITALESESQMELINAQADLADKLIALGNNVNAPKEEWLRMIFTKFMPLPDELVDVISIGSLTQDTQQSDYQPLPAGPSFDNGGLGGEGGPTGPELNQPPAGAEEKLDLPEMPAEASKNKEALGMWLMECNRIRVNHAAKIRASRKKFYDHYFHPDIAYARYKKLGQLNEGMQITEAKQLVETRKRIAASLTESSQKLGLDKNKSVRHSVGRIIRIVEGYYPEFFSLTEEDITLIKKSPKNTKIKTLTERMSKAKANEAEGAHELVKIVESARKTKTTEI